MNKAEIYKEGWDTYATVNSNASCQLVLLAERAPHRHYFTQQAELRLAPGVSPFVKDKIICA